MLTPEQAGDLAQVHVQRIYEWLAQGRAHGMKMLSGQDRVCKNSLFEIREE
jgi:predicted site-specific integrase-resolvase